MKKSIYTALVLVALLLAGASPSQARDHDHFSGGHGHSHFSGGVWIDPWWGPGWGPWWGGAYPYYYGNYWPPAVYNEEPPVYVEPTPQAEEQAYWYFCPDSRNYYPYVKKCPNGWLKVVPPDAPPDYGE